MRKAKSKDAATIWDGKNPNNVNPLCQTCTQTCKYSRAVKVLSCPRYHKADSDDKQ